MGPTGPGSGSPQPSSHHAGGPAEAGPRHAPILELVGIDKSFPGVQALRDARLDVRAGEIHALVGENGAGKSTLIKVATGAHQPDRGEIRLEGRPARIRNPIDALRQGIAAIYQEFNLVPALTVRENLFLGREGRRLTLAARAERARAQEILARLGADFDSETPVGSLSVARQQLVEIGRALLADARLLIMDEPTAPLTPREVDRLFAILAELRAAGHGLLFISHRLDEVLRIADRISVMRDGVSLGTWTADTLTREAMIEKMVGRPLEQEFPKQRAQFGPPLLEVRNLTGGRVRDVSFQVRRGGVVGLAGLVGAGRTDLVRLIFGADPRSSGTILMNGVALRIESPRDAIRHGICLLTEDRKGQGLILGLGARENFSLPSLSRWTSHGWIHERRETDSFLHHVERLKIRLAGPEQPAGHLSGGNQQKLLIARWLESDSQVMIFDEPTRGIDVGAKVEMYLLINELAAHGKAIVMISSELPEILGMSDRVIVMRGGRIGGELREATAAGQAEVMALAVGAGVPEAGTSRTVDAGGAPEAGDR
ncbi:MAG: sugar ABC transporter ATP-binding protein [Candidatus Eisenbacteria bacterium]